MDEKIVEAQHQQPSKVGANRVGHDENVKRALAAPETMSELKTRC